MPGFFELENEIANVCTESDAKELRMIVVEYPLSAYEVYRMYQMLFNNVPLVKEAARLSAQGVKPDDAVKAVQEWVRLTMLKAYERRHPKVRILKLGQR